MSDNPEERHEPEAPQATGAACATEAGESESGMKDCFGVCFGWFMEDMIGTVEQLHQCYECPDYDKCYKMAMIRSLTQLRHDIRRSAHHVGRAIGGSHSSFPFG